MPKLLTQGVSSEPETGRSLIGIVAGFKSERWPDFDRNGGRLQIGIRSVTLGLCNTGNKGKSYHGDHRQAFERNRHRDSPL
ncbi:hypothetical protein DQW09_08860 [Ensifer adhaerens]|nr:hypothetical protein DQW09_08860 [Ensifer adhaerens]